MKNGQEASCWNLLGGMTFGKFCMDRASRPACCSSHCVSISSRKQNKEAKGGHCMASLFWGESIQRRRAGGSAEGGSCGGAGAVLAESFAGAGCPMPTPEFQSR